MAPAFDTLAYARRLREGGFTERQAEAQAEALAAAMTENLATKQDLKELEGRIDARFAQIDARFSQLDARFSQLDTRFEESESRLELSIGKQIAEHHSRILIQMMVQTMATIGAVSAIVKLL
jgi:predicted nuclease with TOPRIM domain